MSGDAKRTKVSSRGPISPARERVADRIRELTATDEQFRNAEPDLPLQQAARQPGLRLPQILELFVEG